MKKDKLTNNVKQKSQKNNTTAVENRPTLFRKEGAARRRRVF